MVTIFPWSDDSFAARGRAVALAVCGGVVVGFGTAWPNVWRTRRAAGADCGSRLTAAFGSVRIGIGGRRPHPARRTPMRAAGGPERLGRVQDPPRRLRPRHPRRTTRPDRGDPSRHPPRDRRTDAATRPCRRWPGPACRYHGHGAPARTRSRWKSETSSSGRPADTGEHAREHPTTQRSGTPTPSPNRRHRGMSARRRDQRHRKSFCVSVPGVGTSS